MSKQKVIMLGGAVQAYRSRKQPADMFGVSRCWVSKLQNGRHTGA
ncbi:UNVERIFIED_ORG: hypothetical protein ABID57_003509 [Arthrobacter sp. UYEF1]